MFLSKKFTIVLVAAIAIATVGASDADADAKKEYNKMRKENISRRIKKEKDVKDKKDKKDEKDEKDKKDKDAMVVQTTFNGAAFAVNFEDDPKGGKWNAQNGAINGGPGATIATGQDGQFEIATITAVAPQELNRADETCATTGCEEGFCCTVNLESRHVCIVTGSSIAATYCA